MNVPNKLSLSFDNMFIPEAIADGEEAEVEIVRAGFHRSEESNNLSVAITLRLTSYPKAALIREYLGWPTDEEMKALELLNSGATLDGDTMEAGQRANNKLLRLRHFCKCFDVDALDWNLENTNENLLTKRRGYVIVAIEPPNERQTEERNRVKKWGGEA